MVYIRALAIDTDINSVVKLHRQCFPTDTRSDEESRMWIEANMRAGPRMRYYVAFDLPPRGLRCYDSGEDSTVLGYILWMERGGFRQDAVLELEQIGVDSQHRGRGIGTELTQKSLRNYFDAVLKPQGRNLATVMVTTGTENEAQKLYRKALGAEVVAVIPELYTGDEAIMVARPPELETALGMPLRAQ